MSTLRSDAFRVQRMCAHCPAVCACVKYIACIFHCICMCETGCETFMQSGSDFCFPGVFMRSCVHLHVMCARVLFIYIASPLGGGAGPWLVCLFRTSLGSIAYIFACCCQRCSRCFAHTCHSSMLRTSSLTPPSRILPTHSCSACTMRGSLSHGYGWISPLVQAAAFGSLGGCVFA